MAVKDDDEAIGLMNDSRYGLTASIWTTDVDAAIQIGDRVETGTWFLNRCDYLDPALAWTGVKDSGRGCSLSQLGIRRADTAEVVPPPPGDGITETVRTLPACVHEGQGLQLIADS